MSKKEFEKEDIENKKSILIAFPDEDSKKNTLGKVQELVVTEESIFAKVKPLLMKTCFEGESVTLERQEKNIQKFAETIKKFESSKHDVLLLVDNKSYAYSKKEFNRISDSILKTIVKKYWEALRKALDKDHVI